MKLSKFTNLLVLGMVLSIAVAGCRKRPEDLARIPGYARTGAIKGPEAEPILPPAVAESKPLPTVPEGIPEGLGHSNWVENAKIFEIDTVHFAFDSSVLRTDDKPKVAAVADYLKSHPINAVKVEGHCDERGTAEYNRSLGERRALAAREQLVHLGIDPTRVDTISYGFDRPVDTGHNEAAWAKNRRGEFILLTPPSKITP